MAEPVHQIPAPAAGTDFTAHGSLCIDLEDARMAFNTSSFLAGVGTVVVVLSTGFAGGYMLASPNRADPPNRLQRVAAADMNSKASSAAAVSPAAVTVVAKPDVVADAAAAQPAPAAVPPTETPAPQPASTQADVGPSVTTPAQGSTPIDAGKIKPQLATAQSINPDRINTDQARAVEPKLIDSKPADNKAIDKKRIEARKSADKSAGRFAEQHRKQRELEVATLAVRRIIHERDTPEVVVDDDQAPAPAPEPPHFGLFGQE
jgi:hypothetical protein